MPRGKEKRLLYVRERTEDGRLIIRAIPLPEPESGQPAGAALAEKKVS